MAFSSTELIRRCKRYQLANYTCAVVKYARDVRYSQDSVATHDRVTLDAIPVVEIAEEFDRLSTYEVIGIDEGQFFPDTVEMAEKLADLGKIVIVAALDGTFQRVGFGNILELIPKAESVVKLTAVCMICYKDASYTKRKSSDTAVEVIGGTDKYLAVCRVCHKLNESPTKEIAVQTPEKCLSDSNVTRDPPSVKRCLSNENNAVPLKIPKENVQ